LIETGQGRSSRRFSRRRSAGKEDCVRRRLLVGVIVIGLVGVGISAQRRPASSAPDETAVRMLSPEAGRSEPGMKSDTDYWLDSQILRLTARYGDATISTERSAGGIVTSRISDRDGNARATLTVRSTVLQYAPAVGDPLLAGNDSGERPTLDAASRQAYSLLKDGTAGLRWQRGLMRRPGVVQDLEPLELHTEWAQGLTAHAVRKFNARVRVKIRGQDRIFSGQTIATRLTRDGVDVGSSMWFPAQQTFMFSVGNVKGSLDPDSLSEKNNGPGGWLFDVNPAWVNLQTISFHYFASQPRPTADARACQPQPGLLARVLDFFTPTVYANQPGCDWPFVWLNGTGYEPCCNRHDICYAAYGCNWKSWWMIWTNWRCDVCNLIVYNCFTYGGDTWNPGDA
jgi:hypothetical protein